MEIKPEIKTETKIKTISNSPMELVKKGQELLRWEAEKLKDEEYEKEAAAARERQKQKQMEIALKKEEAAARKSSEDSITSSSNFDGLSTAVGTYRIRRIDDEYEIIYHTRETGQQRSSMLTRYGDTNWASMGMELLKELLPDVTCVCFKYGDGIKQANESLPVHVDLYCNNAPKTILSDNAAQFKLLNENINTFWPQFFQSPSIKTELLNRNITWRFIPAKAPWYGGVYEKIIGIIKQALYHSHCKFPLLEHN